MRAFAVTAGRSHEETVPRGRCTIVESARVAMVHYPDAGLLVLQARHPRTGGVVLDLDDLPDAALALLRAFARD